jgi:ribonuclease HIII
MGVHRYSTTKELKERTIHTVYSDIESEYQIQSMLMNLNLFCALTSTRRNSNDILPWMFCKNSVIRSLQKRVIRN